MDQSSLKPYMPRFKKLLTQQDSAATEKQTEALDYAAVSTARGEKRSSIEQFNSVAVPLIFYNQSAWDDQDDTWVAQCLEEWIAPDDQRIDEMFRDLGDPSGTPSASDLGNFADQIADQVTKWQDDKELATPQLNPDFDAENPLPGTQYYKYAERWQGEGKQWLYAAAPSDDPADWAPMQERYNEYEASVDASNSASAATVEAATFATTVEAQEGAALVTGLVQETLNQTVTALPDEVVAALSPQELENLAVEANKAVAGQS
jgi:hypothetical protein